MSKSKKTTIEVQGTAIAIVSQKEEDYLSLTDIARGLSQNGRGLSQFSYFPQVASAISGDFGGRS